MFFRDPRMWFLLASPFITTIFSFLIVNATMNFDIHTDDVEERKAL